MTMEKQTKLYTAFHTNAHTHTLALHEKHLRFVIECGKIINDF